MAQNVPTERDPPSVDLFTHKMSLQDIPIFQVPFPTTSPRSDESFLVAMMSRTRRTLKEAIFMAQNVPTERGLPSVDLFTHKMSLQDIPIFQVPFPTTSPRSDESFLVAMMNGTRRTLK